MNEIEKMHRMYSLRVAIGCLLGAMPLEMQTRVKAALGQHILALEEAEEAGVPGADALAKFMTEEFEALQRAAAVMPTFVRPTPAEEAPRKVKRKEQ